MRANDIRDLEALAFSLESDGVDQHGDELRGLAARAVSAGVTPTLVLLMAAADAPAVVRLRAFAKVATELAATPDGTPLARAS